MNKGLGHQPEPPPRPVWEWWRYPACWAVLAIIAGTGVAAATVSAWLWAVFVVLVGAVGFVIGQYRNDCER